jgi:SAM-dependent methyltransferase
MSEPVTTCAWCGADLGAAAQRLRGRVVCPACGVATTDPWPSAADLDDAYEGWYRPQEGRFTGFGDALLRRTRGRLARRLDRIAPPGRVLDVGAGEGALLDALRRQGREAVGLERASRRQDVRETDVTEVEGEWAAIVFWHSLEHLLRPEAALRHAAGLLCPGGVLAIAVPNSASLQAAAFGDRWLALDPPRHLVHLRAGALTERLRRLGLNVERVSFWRGGQVLFGWLHGLVGAVSGDRWHLYDAIRRPAARARTMSLGRRCATIAAATALLPVAALATGIEVAARRGGTVYVEARRA